MIDSIKVSDLKNNQIVDLFSEAIEDTSIKILNLEVDVSISSRKKERVNTVEGILKDTGFRVEFNNPQMSNYWLSNDNMGDSLDVYLKSNEHIRPYVEDFYLSITLPPESGMQWGSMVDNSIDNYFSKIQQDNSTLKITVPIIDLMSDLFVDTLVHIGSIPVIEKETDLRKEFQINYTINEENINKEYKSNEIFFSYYSPEISIVKSTKGNFNKNRADIYLPRQESLKIQINKLLISESLPKLIEPNNKIILWFEDSEWYWINDDFSNYETIFFKIHEIPLENANSFTKKNKNDDIFPKKVHVKYFACGAKWKCVHVKSPCKKIGPCKKVHDQLMGGGHDVHRWLEQDDKEEEEEEISPYSRKKNPLEKKTLPTDGFFHL